MGLYRTVALTVFLLLFAGAQSTSAQVRVGIAGGQSTATLSDVNQGANYDTNHLNSVSVSAIIEVDFSSTFALQLTPTFAKKGSNVHWPGHFSQVSFNSLDLPLMVKFHPLALIKSSNALPVSPYLLGGAYVASLGQATFTFGEDNQRDAGAVHHRRDYGLTGGAGLKIPVGSFQLFFDALYNKGIPNIRKSHNHPYSISYRLESTQFKVGFLWNI